MPYRFLEEETTADVAFEAWAEGLADVFRDAADAVIAVMIENPDAIEPAEERRFHLRHGQLDLLLFNCLEQVLFYKDAERFLARLKNVSVAAHGDGWEVRAVALGERLDPDRHRAIVDVKAVTLHHFSLRQDGGVWRAHVILDI